jgi:hypothetical protein
VNPTEAVAGSPSRSSTQLSRVSSAATAAGDDACMLAFWSHAEVSQSAATTAESAPPSTNPQLRPPADAAGGQAREERLGLRGGAP